MQIAFLKQKNIKFIYYDIDVNKKKERELNKLFRIKKKLDKEFSENPLIEIKISTN